LKKIILDSSPDSEGRICLTGNDFHHLVRVRRVRPGSVINAVLPDGNEAKFTVLNTGGGSLEAVYLTDDPDNRVSGQNPASACPSLYLFQALPKGMKMDLIVRQAAECGVSEIIPFVCENSQIKMNITAGDISGDGLLTEKIRRWNRIVREARQQSGSSVPTVVKNPRSFEGFLDYWKKINEEKPGGVGILFHQDPLAPGSFHDYLVNNPQFVAMAVGPEGGFSPGEAGRLLSAGFLPLVMGDTVLRTETAALYGAAAIRVILMENEFWHLKKNRLRSNADA